MMYACRSKRSPTEYNRRKFYEKMVDEDTDSMLLRLFEAFLEAAPQLVFQLYIISQIGGERDIFLLVLQVASLVTSLLTLSSSLVSFQCSLRLSNSQKADLRISAMIIMFLWRLFTILARVVALAIFASYFHFWVFVVVGMHWTIMLMWVIKQETDYCSLSDTENQPQGNRGLEFCFRFLAAFVQIFCFFNLLEGHTRLRCIVYYAIMYVENTTLILLWYMFASVKSNNYWYHLPAMLAVLVGFWVGIGLQLIYYKCFHPNQSSDAHALRRIWWWVPCKYLSLFREMQWDGPVKSRAPEAARMLYAHSFPSTAGSVPFSKSKPQVTSTPNASMAYSDQISPPNDPHHKAVPSSNGNTHEINGTTDQIPVRKITLPVRQPVQSTKRDKHNLTDDSIKAGGGNLTREVGRGSAPQACRPLWGRGATANTLGPQPIPLQATSQTQKPKTIDNSVQVVHREVPLEVKSTTV